MILFRSDLIVLLTLGDVMHLAIPNSTENHIIAVGAWLCEAIVSLVDPDLSVKILTAQLQDTNAKMVVCSEHSRKVVCQALTTLKSLGKIKVIVLESSQPKPGENFSFDNFLLCI